MTLASLIKDPSPGGPTTDGSTIFTDQWNKIVDIISGEGSENVLFTDGTAALPAISFAGENTKGFYDDGTLSIGVTTNAIKRWEFNAGLFRSALADGAGLNYTGVSSTVPSILPYRSDSDTGIGHLVSSDAMTFISGGIKIVTVGTTQLSLHKDISMGNFNIEDVNNTGVGRVTSWGTSGQGVFAAKIQVAPSTDVTDQFALYAAYQNGAGTASATFRGEDGNIISLGSQGLKIGTSDVDWDLITVGVTGTPKIFWDESVNSFMVSTASDFGMQGTNKIIFNSTTNNAVLSQSDYMAVRGNSGVDLYKTSDGIGSGVRVDADATAGNTRLLIYDVDNATLERVSVGAADSGGSGFKVLRIPN